MEDWKRDTLYRMFSHRTYGKDKENYIINAIWHKLDNLDIEPVTQQCIRFDDGKHALIDLYFPQVNVGVECDEAYHKDNVYADLKRTEKIEDILSSAEAGEDFILFRIDATKSILEIHEDIDNAVKEINARYNFTSKVEPWRSLEEKIKAVITRGTLNISDMIAFPTQAATGPLFNRFPKAWQMSYFKISEEYMLWFPQLAIDVDGVLKAQSSSGWINILSNDWKQIIEYNTDSDKLPALKNNDLKDRIAFAKGKDKYGATAFRFIGIFRPADDNGSREKRVYNLVSDELDLNQFRK